jgi:extracellular elastinolytic metalloproteinase
VDASRFTGTAGRRTIAVAAVLAVAAFLPSSGLGVANIEEIHTDLADFDVRGVEAPTAAQREQARSLRAGVSWNRYGTPQSLYRRGGYLSKPLRTRTAPSAARAWLRSHRALFGLRDLAGLKTERVVRIGRNGRVVVLRERIGGRVSYDGVATISLRRTAAGWRVVHVGSSLSGASRVGGYTRLGGVEAFAHAARNVGLRLSLVELARSGRSGAWQHLRTSRLKGAQYVRPIAFPTGRIAIPAYQTIVSHLTRSGTAIGYSHVVDARTGRILARENVVEHAADNPKWLVFPGYPHSGLDEYPWNYPSSDIRDLWCWLHDPGCQYLPSRSTGDHEIEWDKDARTNTPTFTTFGNNARSAEAWFSPFNPGPTDYMPVSPTRDYVYPWENTWFEERCNPAVFAVPGVGNDISAAVTNLFMGHNRMHDWSYVLGFREATWNAQEYNFGVNTAGERDPIEGIVQAGGANGGYPTYTGRDNAFMRTNPDGTRSQSGMFLWQPLAGSFYAPCVDGDYDMTVIGHEYGHMIENRMIGKGDRRRGAHAGAMGESHGDLIGMEIVNEYGFVPTGGSDNPVADAATTLVGRYVTGNNDRGIRNYDMAFASAGEFPAPGRYGSVNPLNLSDVGYDITGPQVHADGEIWSTTNFDLRELLLDRYPSNGIQIQRDCADGLRPAQECPGNRRWVQLLFDAFLLMPIRPTFIDARDAILAADAVRFGGANEDLLWLGFARRGFGEAAQATDADDPDPRADFASPFHQEATIVFNAFALDEGNAPITNANFYVGHYERGVTPIADTNPATPGPYLDNTAGFVPDDSGRGENSHQRGYDFVVNAQGYGHVRFHITNLQPGETRVVNAYLPTNWASRFKGAAATGDGAFHHELIDDTEGTNWESTGAPVQGRQVLVDLGGAAHRVDAVKVSTLLQPAREGRPGQNRFTALREFEVLGCSADPGGDVTIGGVSYACQTLVRAQPDGFPGDPPRPVAPEMILRAWNAGGGQPVTHVLFRVLNNQCTGQTAFHGEQDDDPANTSTDCRIGTLPTLPPRSNDVRTSELQVFSGRPRVEGATQEE